MGERDPYLVSAPGSDAPTNAVVRIAHPDTGERFRGGAVRPETLSQSVLPESGGRAGATRVFTSSWYDEFSLLFRMIGTADDRPMGSACMVYSSSSRKMFSQSPCKFVSARTGPSSGPGTAAAAAPEPFSRRFDVVFMVLSLGGRCDRITSENRETHACTDRPTPCEPVGDRLASIGRRRVRRYRAQLNIIRYVRSGEPSELGTRSTQPLYQRFEREPRIIIVMCTYNVTRRLLFDDHLLISV